MLASLIQSPEGLNKTGRVREFPLLTAFRVGNWVFPTFGLKLKHWLFLGLELACFWTRTYIVSSAGSPVYQLQILALVSLHNHVSQFLIVNLYVYIHTSYWLCLSGEPWLIHKQRDKETWPNTRKKQERNATTRDLDIGIIRHTLYFYFKYAISAFLYLKNKSNDT